MPTAANVRTGTTGALYGAPAGTALPTDATTALDVLFTNIGYLSDAGVKETNGPTTKQIRAWQNADVVREILTAQDITFGFEALETTGTVLAAFHGNYASGAVNMTGGLGQRQSWILSVLDGVNKIRIVIPDGQLIPDGDIVYKNGEAVVYPFKMVTYPDVTGYKAYKYIA